MSTSASGDLDHGLRTSQLWDEWVRASGDTAEATERRAGIRTELIDANLPLVRHLAGRFTSWNFPYDEAVQIGSIGLIKAVDGFDPSLGHPFAAYAVPKIVGEIRRYLRDSHRLVKVPRRTHELQSAVVNARDDLTHELGRLPAISEIADRIGARPDEVVEVVESFRVREPRSLEVIASTQAPDPEVEAALSVEEGGFATSEWLYDLREAMTGLSEVERLVISRRFGAEMTQAEIAEEIGVSQMQVSRLLRRSLDRLRRRLVDEASN